MNYNVANVSFNAIREYRSLAKITEFTVWNHARVFNVHMLILYHASVKTRNFFERKLVIIFLPIYLNMCFDAKKDSLIEAVLSSTNTIYLAQTQRSLYSRGGVIASYA